MSHRLPDGSRIVLRPIEPEDRDALASGFERLSEESRYRRFFAPISRLRDRDLDYLTRVDHHDHEALIAFEEASGEGIGVARFIRTTEGAAEPAIVVADDWQGRGVGAVLLEALVRRAREEGITRFEALVLATNPDAIRLLSSAGETSRGGQGEEVQLSIELPEAPTRGRARELLRHFATGTVQPVRSMLELLWPHRLGEPGAERRDLIVVGTDGSEHAGHAVEAAARLATAAGSTVGVVGAHGLRGAGRDDLGRAVGEAATRLREQGLEAQEHVRRGDPALVLPRIAHELNARLLVVGAGDRRKATRRLVGSVADAVSERSPCDVLIVRLRDEG